MHFEHEKYSYAKAADMIYKELCPTLEKAYQAFGEKWQSDLYQHHIQYGYWEDINPSNNFDENQYLTDKLSTLQTDPIFSLFWHDKKTDDLWTYINGFGIHVLEHYLSYGRYEGLSVSAVPLSDQLDTLRKHGNYPMIMSKYQPDYDCVE